MPYEITESGCPEGKPFAVRKKGGGVIGCHKSRASAQKQLAALYANEEKSVEKTAIKREHGMDFPPRDYAYVPDPMRPATWKLRLTETPGEVSVMQLQIAAAALSPKGFQGNRLQIPNQTLASVKRRLLAEFRRLKVSEGKIPSSVKGAKEEEFMVWKDAKTGLMRWFAVYSNNFRDNDNPSEIISEKSHLNFIDLVDGGIVDYPELWLWHTKGTTWGKADWLSYSSGFAMASGLVYPGYEFVAQNLMKRGHLQVSHGMPEQLIVHDLHDKSVIIFHVTQEISPLPDWAAANHLTGFHILTEGESAMAASQKKMPVEKKAFLKEAGFDDDFVDTLETNLLKTATIADAAGLESKDATVVEDEGAGDIAISALDHGELQVEARDDADEEEEVEEEEEAEPVVAKAKKPPMATEEAADDKKVAAKKPAKKKEAAINIRTDGGPILSASEFATKQEVADVLTGLMETVSSLSDNLAMLTKEITQLKKSDAEKISHTKEMTPTLSLNDLISRNAIGQRKSAVKEGSSLSDEGPVETEAPPAAAVTLVPAVNEMIARAQAASRAAAH